MVSGGGISWEGCVPSREGCYRPETREDPPERPSSRHHLGRLASREGAVSSRDDCHRPRMREDRIETLPSRDHLGTVASRDGLMSSWDGGNHLEMVLHPPERPPSRDDAGRATSRERVMASRDGSRHLGRRKGRPERPPSRDGPGRVVSRDGSDGVLGGSPPSREGRGVSRDTKHHLGTPRPSQEGTSRDATGLYLRTNHPPEIPKFISGEYKCLRDDYSTPVASTGGLWGERSTHPQSSFD